MAHACGLHVTHVGHACDTRGPFKLWVICTTNVCTYVLDGRSLPYPHDYMPQHLTINEMYLANEYSSYVFSILEVINQDVMKWMLEARRTGNAIKVRYGKVLFSGSCATGKTSFFRLLMKEKMEDQYKSTGLADAHRVIFTTKVYIQSSMSDEDVEFEVLNLNSEISQLRDHMCVQKPVMRCPILPYQALHMIVLRKQQKVLWKQLLIQSLLLQT